MMQHRWDNKDSSMLDWYSVDSGQLTLPLPTTLPCPSTTMEGVSEG